jgi:hypothetical protein
VTGRPDESPLARAPGVGMSAGSGEVGGLPGFVVLVGSPGLVGSRGGLSATPSSAGAGGPVGPVEPAVSTALAGSPASTGPTSPGGSAGSTLLAGTVALVELAGWAALARSAGPAGVAGPGRSDGSTEPAAVVVGSMGRPSVGPGGMDPVGGLTPSAGVDRWGELVGDGDAGWTGAPKWYPESTDRRGHYVEPSMMAGPLHLPGRAAPAVGALSPHRGRGSPPLPTAALSYESALRVRAPRCVLLSRGGVLPVADDVFTPASTRLGARRRREVSRRSLEVRQCAMCRNWATT